MSRPTPHLLLRRTAMLRRCEHVLMAAVPQDTGRLKTRQEDSPFPVKFCLL